MRARLLKILGILIVIEALISTIGVLPMLKYGLTHKSLPAIFGIIKALGGPFEALGINSLIVAGLVFAAVSALKFLAACWLWSLWLDGAVLQAALLGVSAIFWYGFAVPYGLLLGIPQIMLIVLVWGSLQYGWSV